MLGLSSYVTEGARVASVFLSAEAVLLSSRELGDETAVELRATRDGSRVATWVISELSHGDDGGLGRENAVSRATSTLLAEEK